MEVILRSVKRRVKKPVVRDHYWYDPETQRQLYGRGGEMIFVYDPSKKKSVPRIIDAEEWVLEDSYDDIIDWVRVNNVSITNRAPKHFVTVTVDAHRWSSLEDDLYRNRITYDYDAKELRQELEGAKL